MLSAGVRLLVKKQIKLTNNNFFLNLILFFKKALIMITGATTKKGIRYN